MLGIIGAMGEGVQLLRSQMTRKKEFVHTGVTGKFKGVEIALAQFGIGKINVTIYT
jgi:adenosylhomocysteine nucleosidase